MSGAYFIYDTKNAPYHSSGLIEFGVSSVAAVKVINLENVPWNLSQCGCLWCDWINQSNK